MSDIQKRICCAIHSLRAGGMERVMSELAGYFSGKEKTEIHLVLYGIKRDVFYSVPDSVIIHRPEFEFNNNYRTFYTLRTLFFLRSKIKEIDPHTILSFGEQWNNMVLLSAIGLNYPVYVSDRCQPDKSIGRFHDFLRKKLYPRAEGIVAQTALAKEIYQRQFHNPNIQVIGNPIRSVSDAGNGRQKENIVLSVGRLIETKHHDELIKLFVNIDRPDWKLVIVGGDALKQNRMEQLQSLIRQLGAEDKIYMAGYREDVDSYYRKSKLFAFTSSSEGFPNVIGEAMSAGLPVVAFDCIAGPSDMIEDGDNGFLIPLFEYDTFEKKLRLLMENEDMRVKMGEKAKKSIRRYSVKSVADKYYQFLFSYTGTERNDG